MSEGTQMDRRRWIYRHPLKIRITHWINVFCLAILLLSSLQILNADPALCLGTTSHFVAPSLEVRAVTADAIANRAATRSGQSLAEQSSKRFLGRAKRFLQSGTQQCTDAAQYQVTIFVPGNCLSAFALRGYGYSRLA